MPQTAKLKNIKNYGAKIEVYGKDCVESELKARDTTKCSGQAYISPYNDPLVLAGRGPSVLKLKINVKCLIL